MQFKVLGSKILQQFSFVAVFIFGLILLSYNAYADDPENVPTVISVNNAAPSFSVDPYEESNFTFTASTSSTPTNVGSAITFRATGDDQDGNNYYLAVCKTAAVTPHNNAVPTCDVGTWCVSSSTADEVSTSCQYTVQTGDAENSPWYAFVCDYSSDSKCSAVYNPAVPGDSDSPFVVNHVPSLTTVNNDTGAGVNPGTLVTFTSDGSDTDTYDTTDDELTLLICSSPNAIQTTPYTAPTCVATTLATTAVPATDNPSAEFSIPSVYLDGTFTAHAFVYDEHNLLHVGRATTQQATSVNTNWIVNNIDPVMTIHSFNFDTLTLTESLTTPLIAYVDVQDSNSCQDIDYVRMDFWGTWLPGGHTDCDAAGDSDGDVCYPVITCTVDSGTNGCAGSSDDSVRYNCTAPVQYYAESTGALGSMAQHEESSWTAFVMAADEVTEVTDSDGTLQVSPLIAFSTSGSINYGAVDAGEVSANIQLPVTCTGNTNIDTEVGATNQTGDVTADYSVCTNYPTCSGNHFETNNQEYATSSFTHGTGEILRDRRDVDYPLELELNVLKTTSDLVGEEPIYWSSEVPAGTPSGEYSGSNTLIAVQGEW